VIEGCGKLANLIAPANIDTRIPSSAGNFAGAFGKLLDGLVIRAEIQKLISNPTNRAAAATAPAIFRIWRVNNTNSLRELPTKKMPRSSLVAAGPKGWHETIPHRPGPWSN